MGASMYGDTQRDNTVALRLANLEEQKRFDWRFKGALPGTLARDAHAMVLKYARYPSRDVPYHVATSRAVQVAEMIADFNERCARLVVGHA